MAKPKTTAQFIQDARKIHGDKYDYSLTEYVNAITKVKIICPCHGEFYQGANSHLMGSACTSCASVSRASKRRKTKEQFILDAQRVHGDKYDYSLVRYKNNKIPVKIVCPEHGPFEQKPRDHLKGGCWFCGVERNRRHFSKTKEQFILDAQRVHGNKYDYSLVL